MQIKCKAFETRAPTWMWSIGGIGESLQQNYAKQTLPTNLCARGFGHRLLEHLIIVPKRFLENL